MGTRADFYIMDHDGSLEWLGSVSQDGGIVHIPAEILICGNETIFEESVEDFITTRGERGILKSIQEEWPWPWADSRLTDYSYIFNVCTGKVLVSMFGGRLMDAVKLYQGMDQLGADEGIGIIKFPVMNKDALQTQEETIKLVEEYGSESTETV